MAAPKLSQDAKLVYIQLPVQNRHTASEEKAQFEVDEDTFIFHLCGETTNLKFPGLLNELGEDNRLVYNRERGHFTCRIEKRTPGEEFKGLEGIQTNTS